MRIKVKLKMSYKKLEIWQLANKLVIDIQKMSMNLPKFELYEEASQIRKSIKNVKATIVDGYGRRSYKNDFIRFLIYSQASNDETIDHLENLYNTGSLKDAEIYQDLHQRLDVLGRKLNRFIQAVQCHHKSIK